MTKGNTGARSLYLKLPETFGERNSFPSLVETKEGNLTQINLTPNGYQIEFKPRGGETLKDTPTLENSFYQALIAPENTDILLNGLKELGVRDTYQILESQKNKFDLNGEGQYKLGILDLITLEISDVGKAVSVLKHVLKVHLLKTYDLPQEIFDNLDDNWLTLLAVKIIAHDLANIEEDSKNSDADQQWQNDFWKYAFGLFMKVYNLEETDLERMGVTIDRLNEGNKVLEIDTQDKRIVQFLFDFISLKYGTIAGTRTLEEKYAFRQGVDYILANSESYKVVIDTSRNQQEYNNGDRSVKFEVFGNLHDHTYDYRVSYSINPDGEWRSIIMHKEEPKTLRSMIKRFSQGIISNRMVQALGRRYLRKLEELGESTIITKVSFSWNRAEGDNTAQQQDMLQKKGSVGVLDEYGNVATKLFDFIPDSTDPLTGNIRAIYNPDSAVIGTSIELSSIARSKRSLLENQVMTDEVGENLLSLASILTRRLAGVNVDELRLFIADVNSPQVKRYYELVAYYLLKSYDKEWFNSLDLNKRLSILQGFDTFLHEQLGNYKKGTSEYKIVRRLYKKVLEEELGLRTLGIETNIELSSIARSKMSLLGDQAMTDEVGENLLSLASILTRRLAGVNVDELRLFIANSNSPQEKRYYELVAYYLLKSYDKEWFNSLDLNKRLSILQGFDTFLHEQLGNYKKGTSEYKIVRKLYKRVLEEELGLRTFLSLKNSFKQAGQEEDLRLIVDKKDLGELPDDVMILAQQLLKRNGFVIVNRTYNSEGQYSVEIFLPPKFVSELKEPASIIFNGAKRTFNMRLTRFISTKEGGRVEYIEQGIDILLENMNAMEDSHYIGEARKRILYAIGSSSKPSLKQYERFLEVTDGNRELLWAMISKRGFRVPDSNEVVEQYRLNKFGKRIRRIERALVQIDKRLKDPNFAFRQFRLYLKAPTLSLLTQEEANNTFLRLQQAANLIRNLQEVGNAEAGESFNQILGILRNGDTALMQNVGELRRSYERLQEESRLTDYQLGKALRLFNELSQFFADDYQSKNAESDIKVRIIEGILNFLELGEVMNFLLEDDSTQPVDISTSIKSARHFAESAFLRILNKIYNREIKEVGARYSIQELQLSFFEEFLNKYINWKYNYIKEKYKIGGLKNLLIHFKRDPVIRSIIFDLPYSRKLPKNSSGRKISRWLETLLKIAEQNKAVPNIRVDLDDKGRLSLFFQYKKAKRRSITTSVELGGVDQALDNKSEKKGPKAKAMQRILSVVRKASVILMLIPIVVLGFKFGPTIKRMVTYTPTPVVYVEDSSQLTISSGGNIGADNSNLHVGVDDGGEKVVTTETQKVIVTPEVLTHYKMSDLLSNDIDSIPLEIRNWIKTGIKMTLQTNSYSLKNNPNQCVTFVEVMQGALGIKPKYWIVTNAREAYKAIPSSVLKTFINDKNRTFGGAQGINVWRTSGINHDLIGQVLKPGSVLVRYDDKNSPGHTAIIPLVDYHNDGTVTFALADSNFGYSEEIRYKIYRVEVSHIEEIKQIISQFMGGNAKNVFILRRANPNIYENLHLPPTVSKIVQEHLDTGENVPGRLGSNLGQQTGESENITSQSTGGNGARDGWLSSYDGQAQNSQKNKNGNGGQGTYTSRLENSRESQEDENPLNNVIWGLIDEFNARSNEVRIQPTNSDHVSFGIAVVDYLVPRKDKPPIFDFRTEVTYDDAIVNSRDEHTGFDPSNPNSFGGFPYERALVGRNDLNFCVYFDPNGFRFGSLNRDKEIQMKGWRGPANFALWPYVDSVHKRPYQLYSLAHALGSKVIGHNEMPDNMVVISYKAFDVLVETLFNPWLNENGKLVLHRDDFPNTIDYINRVIRETYNHYKGDSSITEKGVSKFIWSQFNVHWDDPNKGVDPHQFMEIVRHFMRHGLGAMTSRREGLAKALLKDLARYYVKHPIKLEKVIKELINILNEETLVQVYGKEADNFHYRPRTMTLPVNLTQILINQK